MGRLRCREFRRAGGETNGKTTWVLLGMVLCALPLGIGLGALLSAYADEVPYIPSQANVVDAMLSIAEVGPQDYVVDLGSGDGRIVIAAAKRYGARGLGIELDRTLVAGSRANAAREGVSDKVTFLHQDIFDADFHDATVVTMYLLPEVNLQLRPRILFELRPGTRIVSHDYDMADWEPERSLVIPVPEKTVGLRKESSIYLWIVPARIAGYWRGTLTGPQGEEPVLIEFLQRFQNASATIHLRSSSMAGGGRIQGDTISLSLRRQGIFESQLLHFTLRVTEGRIQGEAVEGGQRYVLRATRIMN
jgi:SAM-dependent methyltransferase